MYDDAHVLPQVWNRATGENTAVLAPNRKKGSDLKKDTDPLANIIGSLRFPITCIQWIGPEEEKILTISPLDEGDDLQFWELPKPGATNCVVETP